MSKFTKSQAQSEIAYRALPKPRPPRDFEPGEARRASGAELRAIAGKSTPRPRTEKAQPKVETPEQLVSKLITRAAQAHAAATEGPGFVKRVINARAKLLSVGDLAAQREAAEMTLAHYGVQV